MSDSTSLEDTFDTSTENETYIEYNSSNELFEYNSSYIEHNVEHPEHAELSQDEMYHPDYVPYVLTTFYVCIFSVGIVGNILTCAVIVLKRSMLTNTNFYLLNLAVTDFIFTILHFYYEMKTIWTQYRGVILLRICWRGYWISESLINVSILTITAFSVERYLAICKPFRSQKRSCVIKVIVLIWIVALACPYFASNSLVFSDPSQLTYLSDAEKLYYECSYIKDILWRYLLTTFVLLFVTPMIILLVLYSLIGVAIMKSSRIEKSTNRKQTHPTNESQHNKIDDTTKKTLKMLVVIVVMFFVCWAPFHIERLMAVYSSDDGYIKFPFWYREMYWTMFYASGVVYLLSAAINPIIYSVMSKAFREALKDILVNGAGKRILSCCKCTKGENAKSSQQISFSSKTSTSTETISGSTV